jgi:uncharacterized phiE125 gp8 family phage protein|tara:strand:- start:13990 stop:14568 length:579 start_codon:yes stop_codon:yes gene_type:complete
MSWTSFKVTTAPASEPISTAEAKTQLRIDGSSEDTLIGNYITVARQTLEILMRRAFITQTITLKYDKFPSRIRLPRPPAISVTSIQYVDTNGATQTWSASDYTVDSQIEPASIVPAYDKDYPDTRDIPNAVTVTYTAGYGAASDVPENIKLAIRLLVGHYYENREATTIKKLSDLPLGLQMLVSSIEIPEVL